MCNVRAKLEKIINFVYSNDENMGKRISFALFGNIYQPEKSASVQKLLSILRKHNADIMIDRSFRTYLTDVLHISVTDTVTIQDDDFTADVAISMGGDGTFLEAARKVGDKQIPILGINMGRLGFLADFTPEDIEYAIDGVCSGELNCVGRSVLEVKYSVGSPQSYPYALNEVAVLKRDNSSMISIRVEVGGEYLTTYQADGLIVNTPTGSTGYALSVGGPVMMPGSGILGLVPVAPHSLNVRPITIDDDMEITLSIESRSHNFLVAIDGRSEKCMEGTRITIRKAPHKVFIVKRQGSSFFHTLRSKLLWGSDIRS